MEMQSDLGVVCYTSKQTEHPSRLLMDLSIDENKSSHFQLINFVSMIVIKDIYI